MNAEIARFAALAVLMVGLFAWLRQAIRKLDAKLDGNMGSLDANTGSLRDDLSAKFDALRDDLSALRERMAHLEELVEGLREAITRRSA